MGVCSAGGGVLALLSSFDVKTMVEGVSLRVAAGERLSKGWGGVPISPIFPLLAASFSSERGTAEASGFSSEVPFAIAWDSLLAAIDLRD